ncbi:MAG: hypothetical protein ACK51V_01095 [bacterium]
MGEEHEGGGVGTFFDATFLKFAEFLARLAVEVLAVPEWVGMRGGWL